jgi:hypothetical protein
MKFTYSIDRIVSFNGSAGLSSEETLSESESRDKRAVAIYIKTMRFGLENAFIVMSHRCHENSVPFTPVSLCCQYVLRNGTFEQLVASPIPCEEHQRKPGLKISQGELFYLKQPTKQIFSDFGRILWFFNSKNDDDDDQAVLTSNCLVKVSCLSVHSFFVHPMKCDKALTQLYIKCMSDDTLKQTLSKVLLGYCFTDSTNCLISIMNDLQNGDKVFKKLEHQKFYQQGKLSKLWDGFCDLVNLLLLPMADVNVIHLDIRSTNNCTYNILVHDGESRMELSLIDFDSIVPATAADDVDKKGDNGAIWYNQLVREHIPVVEKVPAYYYLYWQILWIAYRWHPPPAACNNPQVNTSVNYVVSSLFKDGDYCSFKSWLGKHYDTLRSINNVNITRKQIQDALGKFQELF